MNLATKEGYILGAVNASYETDGLQSDELLDLDRRAGTLLSVRSGERAHKTGINEVFYEMGIRLLSLL